MTLNCGLARLGLYIRAGDKKKKKIKNTSLFFFYLYLRTLTKGNLLLSNLLFLWLPSFFISAFYYNYDYPTKESLYSSQELNFFFLFSITVILWTGLWVSRTKLSRALMFWFDNIYILLVQSQDYACNAQIFNAPYEMK